MSGSSETPEVPAPAPAAASVVFGERLPLAEAYAGLLASAGVERGLIGPREVPRLWDRHVLNCGVLADAMPESGTVADIGSGAGLPGLVLAIARPALTVTLVEPLLRRVTFLDEAVAQLGLTNVEVVRSRAEQLSGRTFDVTTSRAVAPLPRLVGWCLPLTAVGGAVVAMKGSSAQDEVDAVDVAAWARSGAEVPVVETVGAGVVDPVVTVVRLVRVRETRVRLGGRADGTPSRTGASGRRGAKAARQR